jgi:transcriptional regulator
MYVPAAFAEHNLAKLHDFIEQHSFGLLVSQVNGEPFATHLPLLLERAAGPQGALVGHVAQANLQWESLAEQAVLAVFSGPHAYISPSWYEADNVVPTWNYSAVHVYGRVTLVDDPDSLFALVQATTEAYEKSRPVPWAVGERNTFLDRLLAMIVGFRIDIERIEGKWKLSQNHPVERRQKVIRELRKRDQSDDLEVARLMEQMLPADEEV